MTTINVQLDGKSLFWWEGDEARYRKMERTFINICASNGLDPDEMAVTTVRYIRQKGTNKGALQLQIAGVLYYIFDVLPKMGFDFGPKDLIEPARNAAWFDLRIEEISGGANISVIPHIAESVGPPELDVPGKRVRMDLQDGKLSIEEADEIVDGAHRRPK
jgi:hypothetical protein